jgi:hypothetical protein
VTEPVNKIHLSVTLLQSVWLCGAPLLVGPDKAGFISDCMANILLCKILHCHRYIVIAGLYFGKASKCNFALGLEMS